MPLSLEQREERRLRSCVTTTERNAFVDGPVWALMGFLLQKRLARLHRVLESAVDGVEVRRLQGQIKEVRFWLELPDVLRDEEPIQEDE